MLLGHVLCLANSVCQEGALALILTILYADLKEFVFYVVAFFKLIKENINLMSE